MELYDKFIKNFDAEANKLGVVGTELATARREFDDLKEESKKQKTPMDFLKDGVKMEDILYLVNNNKKLSKDKLKKRIEDEFLKNDEDFNRFIKSIKNKFDKNKKETKEATSAGAGAGAYDSTFLGKEETKEATTSASSGQYSTPSFLAKSKSKKDWRGKSDKFRIMPGAKFVKIKDKCSKYNNKPHCSQGAIDNPLELSETEIGKNVIKSISKEFGISEDYIKYIIKKEIN